MIIFFLDVLNFLIGVYILVVAVKGSIFWLILIATLNLGAILYLLIKDIKRYKRRTDIQS